MLKTVTLNTGFGIDPHHQLAAWKLLLASAGSRADVYILYPTKDSTVMLLKNYGEVRKSRSILGLTQATYLQGASTPEFVHFLVDHVAPEDIQSMEFAKGEQMLFQHYERGKKVTACLEEEQLQRLKIVCKQSHVPDNIFT